MLTIDLCSIPVLQSCFICGSKLKRNGDFRKHKCVHSSKASIKTVDHCADCGNWCIGFAEEMCSEPTVITILCQALGCCDGRESTDFIRKFARTGSPDGGAESSWNALQAFQAISADLKPQLAQQVMAALQHKPSCKRRIVSVEFKSNHCENNSERQSAATDDPGLEKQIISFKLKTCQYCRMKPRNRIHTMEPLIYPIAQLVCITGSGHHHRWQGRAEAKEIQVWRPVRSSLMPACLLHSHSKNIRSTNGIEMNQLLWTQWTNKWLRTAHRIRSLTQSRCQTLTAPQLQLQYQILQL